MLRIQRASLVDGYPHPRESIVEVAFSLAQWGAFVSSVGGVGAPCTINRLGGERVDPVPFASRFEDSLSEIKAAAGEAMGPVNDRLTAVQALFDSGAGKKAMREALRSLSYAVQSAPANLEFAGTQLVEHAETVVASVKADISSMASNSGTTTALGLAEASEHLPELTV